MIDSRKLLLFTIGIMFGTTLGVGTYIVLTNQQQLTETKEYKAQIQKLNGILEEQEANITQLEQDQQVLQTEINQLREQIEEQTQQQDTQEEQQETPQEPEQESPQETEQETEELSDESDLIELPVRVRMVTSSDWSTLTFVDGEWDPHIIKANSHAEDAGYDEKSMHLTQSIERALEDGIVEMTIDASLKIPLNSADKEEKTKLKLTFIIEKGSLGWTHIEISNYQSEDPIIVDNYWFSSDGDNKKTIQVPISYLDIELLYDPSNIVNNTSLHGLALFGYQGWFASPEDGSDRDQWLHWFTYDNIPDSDHLTVDFWPDMSEYNEDERYPTDMVLQDGTPAELFSSYNLNTVDLHFEWMEEYGLDGVIFQRFIVGLDDPLVFGQRNKVLQNVRISSERHGRVFLVQYDLSGFENDLEALKEDWMFLVDTLGITDSSSYLYHNGRPALGLWGIGFEHIDLEPEVTYELLEWLQYDAPEQYRVSVIGGVPTYWRTLRGDSHTDPAWSSVYNRLDVISPWTVGRYEDEMEADDHLSDLIIPDMEYTSRHGNEYMTVIWPGFSWHNMYPETQLDMISRNNGEFIWRQAYNVISAGSDMLFIAMFDEVDEGTAMFKLATSDQLPLDATLVPVNIQDPDLPSDHYLLVGSKITQMLHGEIPLIKSIP